MPTSKVGRNFVGEIEIEHYKSNCKRKHVGEIDPRRRMYKDIGTTKMKKKQ